MKYRYIMHYGNRYNRPEINQMFQSVYRLLSEKLQFIRPDYVSPEIFERYKDHQIFIKNNRPNLTIPFQGGNIKIETGQLLMLPINLKRFRIPVEDQKFLVQTTFSYINLHLRGNIVLDFMDNYPQNSPDDSFAVLEGDNILDESENSWIYEKAKYHYTNLTPEKEKYAKDGIWRIHNFDTEVIIAGFLSTKRANFFQSFKQAGMSATSIRLINALIKPGKGLIMSDNTLTGDMMLSYRNLQFSCQSFSFWIEREFRLIGENSHNINYDCRTCRTEGPIKAGKYDLCRIIEDVRNNTKEVEFRDRERNVVNKIEYDNKSGKWNE